MIVAFPYSLKDEGIALDLAHWLRDLGGCQNHTVIHCYDSRCSPDTVATIDKILKETFGKGIDLPFKQTIDGWPMGPNRMFQLVANAVVNRPDFKYFLWLEPDAAPLKEGWLDTLEREYLVAGKPFMGGRVHGVYEGKEVPLHMTGVGIYPSPLYDYAGEAWRCFDVAWDIAAKDQIVPKAHFTMSFCHAWNHPGMKNISELHSIPPAAVIHHGVKDGSLLRLLREQRNPPSMCGTGNGETGVQPAEERRPNLQPNPSAPVPPGIFQTKEGYWVIEGDAISAVINGKGRLDADDLIPKLLPFINEGDTVFDVGAFVGDHTVAYAQKVGSKGRVFAFEPNPVAYQCLVHNVGQIVDGPEVVHERFALGDDTAFTPMAIDLKHHGGAYIARGSDPTSGVVPVVMMKLDHWIGEKPDFIKIDVEGYELEVLKGAKNLISSLHPTLALEINYEALKRQGTSPGEIFEWLENYGYSHEIIHDCSAATPLYDIVAKPVAVETVKAKSSFPVEVHPPPAPLSIGQHMEAIVAYAKQDNNHRSYIVKLLKKHGLRK